VELRLLRTHVMTNLISNQPETCWTDSEAIRRAQEGDSAAFEHLYKTHCRRVYSVCLRMIKNPAEADDLTQQTFLQLFRKIGSFRGESGFSTWLHRVTVNVVLLHLRRRRPAEVGYENLDSIVETAEGTHQETSRDHSMRSAIDRLNLTRAVAQLPPGYKQFFMLYDVLGYEHKEIARILGCSIGCSKSQLHKARKRLRQLLEGRRRRRNAMPASRSGEIRPGQTTIRNTDQFFPTTFFGFAATDAEI
jgi:RNA polymerase sigma-70 factor (ECF subfamily)